MMIEGALLILVGAPLLAFVFSFGRPVAPTTSEFLRATVVMVIFLLAALGISLIVERLSFRGGWIHRLQSGVSTWAVVSFGKAFSWGDHDVLLKAGINLCVIIPLALFMYRHLDKSGSTRNAGTVGTT